MSHFYGKLKMLLDTPICDFGWDAPDFTLKDANGQRFTMSDQLGKHGLVITFICNHCPYVKAKVDALNELYEKCGKDIAIIGINSNDSMDYPEDSFDAMKQTAKEKKFQFDYTIPRRFIR